MCYDLGIGRNKMKKYSNHDLFNKTEKRVVADSERKEKLMVNRAKLVEKAKKHGDREPIDCGKYWKREYNTNIHESMAKCYKQMVEQGIMTKVDAVKAYTAHLEEHFGYCVQDTNTYKRLVAKCRKEGK